MLIENATFEIFSGLLLIASVYYVFTDIYRTLFIYVQYKEYAKIFEEMLTFLKICNRRMGVNAILSLPKLPCRSYTVS